jgi:hypothetical protein
MGIKKGLRPRLAEVGKIKIGGHGEERKKSGGGTFRLPIRYDHFVVTTTEKDKKTDNFIVNDALMAKLDPRENWKDGQQYPQPKEIKVALLFDSIDMNFMTSFAYYKGRRCICRGDGETAQREFDGAGKPKHFKIIDNEDGKTQDGERHEVICNTELCPDFQEDKDGKTNCKPSGILSCIIPESGELGGVYRFRTHSWNSISNILGSLEFIQSLTSGILQGLPMKLQFLKKATQDHGNVSVVNIVLDVATYQSARDVALIEHRNRAEYGVNVQQIEEQARQSGFMVDTDEPADVASEFFTRGVPDDALEKSGDITDRAEAALGNVDTSIVEDAEIVPETEDPPAEEPPQNAKSDPAPADDTNSESDDGEGDELDIF